MLAEKRLTQEAEVGQVRLMGLEEGPSGLSDNYQWRVGSAGSATARRWRLSPLERRSGESSEAMSLFVVSFHAVPRRRSNALREIALHASPRIDDRARSIRGPPDLAERQGASGLTRVPPAASVPGTWSDSWSDLSGVELVARPVSTPFPEQENCNVSTQ
jgi:hypothetical protein